MADPAQYLALTSIPLVSGAFDAGDLLTEGQNIPVGWVPTPAVDPLNDAAVAAFHAIRPEAPPAARQFDPQTFWEVAELLPSCTLWRLTGLGAGLDPVGS
jgi:hypothetical protein